MIVPGEPLRYQHDHFERKITCESCGHSFIQRFESEGYGNWYPVGNEDHRCVECGEFVEMGD